jgi:predicted amidophosphoribosyltransferase
MSLPDYLLDDDERECIACGSKAVEYGSLCNECMRNIRDLYADEAIEDRKERT